MGSLRVVIKARSTHPIPPRNVWSSSYAPISLAARRHVVGCFQLARPGRASWKQPTTWRRAAREIGAYEELQTLRGGMGWVDLALMTTRSDPIQLTTQLMSIESTSGQEAAVINWLDAYLRDRGWRTQRIPVTPGRDDLFATA